jgi:hypothetical protein
MPENLTDLDDLHNDDLTNTSTDGATPTDDAASSNLGGDQDDTNSTNGTGDDSTNDSTNPLNNSGYVPVEDVPAIEQYLSQFGILGGIIQFEEGESKHFDELSEVEKFNVLKDLADSNNPKIEDEYGLDEQEIGLLNYLRNQGKPINESLEELAQQRAAQLLALNNSASEDFTNMDDDAITMRWLKETDPEASEEDLAEELTRQKESKLYTKNANRLREQFVTEQNNAVTLQKQQEQEAFLAELESQRSEIATAVNAINEVAGFEVSNNDKNEILHDLLEVNEHGDSLFMEEVFSSPENLFKAAWFYKNGNNILDNLEKYYKGEIAKAYQNGKSEAINGLSRSPISGSRSSSEPNNSNSSPRKEAITDIDDLHND